MEKPTIDDIVHCVIWGLKFGYPTCCIKFFFKRQINGTMEKDMVVWSMFGGFYERKRKLVGTGYICCDECNAKYSKEQLVERINKNRLVPGDFPNDKTDHFDLNKMQNTELRDVKSLVDEIEKDIEEYRPTWREAARIALFAPII